MKRMPFLILAVTLASAALESSGQEAPVFRSDTQVVVLDVVADDRKGVPLGDLRADELQVLEDGRPCELLSFRLVRALPAGGRDPGKAPEAVPAAAGPASTPTRASLVVLLFDRLSTRTTPLARKGALDLLAGTFPADTWFAVFKVGYELQLLASFTTNTVSLQAAVDRATTGDADKRLSPLAPPLPPVRRATEETATEPPVEPATGPRIPSLREVARDLSRLEQQEAQRVETLDSLLSIQAIARALEGVQGRKSIVYFAESAHLPPGAQGAYDTTVSVANRANVAVSTVDARGLTSHKPMALTPTDSVLDQFTADHREGPGAGATTPELKAGGSSDEGGMKIREVFEPGEQALGGPVLQRLAIDTGGHAIENTNDLGGGLALVARELGQYYELVYAPANPAQDGRFRRVSVRSSRPGVRLRTRTGYFATPGRTAALPAYELPLMAALAERTPSTHFALRAGLLHFAPRGGERECVLIAEVPLSQVQLRADEPHGVYRGHLSFLGHLKDLDGRTVARLSQDWPLQGALRELPGARRQSALFRGTLRLAPGRYRLEAAAQDRESGATSVARFVLDVPAADPALALASVAVLRRVDAAGPAPDDPLKVGNVSLVPDVGAPLEPVGGAELPLFLGLYPGRPLEPVQVALEFRRDGQVVARRSPRCPPRTPMAASRGWAACPGASWRRAPTSCA